MRFPPERLPGILYVRRGNLHTDEEVRLIERFLVTHLPEEFRGCLVTLYLDRTTIRR